jgi:hypothetical protein
LIKRTDVNSYRGYRLSVASGSIIASIVSFNSSIEIGFCSTECPRKSDGSQRVPESVMNRIGLPSLELGYHRESARIANCGRSRKDAMTEFLNHSRYGLASLQVIIY